MGKRLKESSKGHIYTKLGHKFGFDITLDATKEIDPEHVDYLASHFPEHFESDGVENETPAPENTKTPEPTVKNVKQMQAEIKASTDVEFLKSLQVGEERDTVLKAIEKRLKELETPAPENTKTPEPTSERTKFASVEAEKAAEAANEKKGGEDADDDDLNDDDLDDK